jgi:hypothetical protein
MRAGEGSFETYWYCIDVSRRTIQTRNPPVQTAIVPVMSSRGQKADLVKVSADFTSFHFVTVQYSQS